MPQIIDTDGPFWFFYIWPIFSFSNQIARSMTGAEIALKVYVISYPSNSQNIIGFFVWFLALEVFLVIKIRFVFSVIGDARVKAGFVKEPPNYFFGAQRIAVDDFRINNNRPP